MTKVEIQGSFVVAYDNADSVVAFLPAEVGTVHTTPTTVVVTTKRGFQHVIRSPQPIVTLIAIMDAVSLCVS